MPDRPCMKALEPAPATGETCVHEGGTGGAEVVAVGERRFHQKIVRVLAIDQGGNAVGRLSRLEQQRIAALAHERIGRDHQFQPQCPLEWLSRRAMNISLLVEKVCVEPRGPPCSS